MSKCFVVCHPNNIWFGAIFELREKSKLTEDYYGDSDIFGSLISNKHGEWAGSRQYYDITYGFSKEEVRFAESLDEAIKIKNRIIILT